MIREEHFKDEELHEGYTVIVWMEGISKDKKYLELLNYLNHNNDCKVKLGFKVKEGDTCVDYECDKKCLFDSFDNAICEFSKKYNNSIIGYTKWVLVNRIKTGLEGISSDSHIIFIKDGRKIAEYVKYYRPVYNDGIKKFDKKVLYNDLIFENDFCLIKDDQTRTVIQNETLYNAGGYKVVFKKPLQLYYIFDNNGDKKEVSYNEFIKIFSTPEISIFDEYLKPIICDEKDITNSTWIGDEMSKFNKKWTCKDVDDILTKEFEKGGFNELNKCYKIYVWKY